MPRWMINCEEHSRLASRDQDGPLSFWDRMGARVHRWMCPPCRQFTKQLETIRKACKNGLAGIDENQGAESATLPEDACRRMKDAIRDRLTR